MSYIKKAIAGYLIVILTFLVGVFATSWMALNYYKTTRIETVHEFHTDTRERFEAIENALKANVSVVTSVVAFYNASDYVDEGEFTTYVNSVLSEYTYMEAIDWAPMVTAKERELIEAEGNKFHTGYKFLQKTEDGKFIRRDDADEYVPIFYISPERDKVILGFDYNSDPVRKEALQEARKTGKITVTRGVKLVKSGDKGILFFSPVFKDMQDIDSRNFGPTKKLEGFIVAVVPLKNIVDLAIEPLKPKGVNIIIHDVTDKNSASYLYTRPSRITDMTLEEATDSYKKEHKLRDERKINIAGREWLVTIIPADKFYVLGAGKNFWLIYGSGLAFTILLCYYMILRIKENQRISEEVEERTRELSHTKKEVELILNSTIEGIIGLDKDGVITFCNPVAMKMLGYSNSQIINHNYYKLIQHSHANGKPLYYEQSNVWAVLNYGGETRAIDNEVFWRKDNTPLQVEYTASSVTEEERVTGAVVVFRDITERKQYEDELQQIARYDQLTQIPNRTYFIDLVKKAMARVDRTSGQISILYMDLNGFKPVNDTKGHAAGDKVLKEFAVRITKVLREHDTLARIGGDEFAVLADNIIDTSECIKIAERINAALEPLFNIDGDEFIISASIGIAIYPKDAATLDELMRSADKAMYNAKKNKKLPYLFYSLDMN